MTGANFFKMDAGPKPWGWASLLLLVYPHNILHNHCFEFLPGITVVPREIENNCHAVKIVCKRKFTYIIEARINLSAATCLKCRQVQQVWKGD